MKEGKSDLWNIISLLKKVIFGAFVVIIMIVASFIFYLMKREDVTTTIDTTGVYNLVNSENGDIIATDLTVEDIGKLMEIINGEN